MKNPANANAKKQDENDRGKIGAKIRISSAQGKFYPSDADTLRETIRNFIGVDRKAPKVKAIGCILPHAGYSFSGRVAAQTASSIYIKDTVILIGPNHRGIGAPFSVMNSGCWQTPLGQIKINDRLADKIIEKSSYLKEDNSAHINEHSIEVTLPILQYAKSNFTIVPIAIFSDNLTALKQIGKDIISAILELDLGQSVTFVASSDMTHYEDVKQAHIKDKIALGAILRLNEDELMKKIREFDISMCGFAAVITMLVSAKLLGAKCANLISYQTSADTTGDTTSVVGYAGVIIS